MEVLNNINLKMCRDAGKVRSQWGRRRCGVNGKKGCSTGELGQIILGWWMKRTGDYTTEEEMVLEFETELYCRRVMWACPVC